MSELDNEIHKAKERLYQMLHDSSLSLEALKDCPETKDNLKLQENFQLAVNVCTLLLKSCPE